MAFEQRVGRAVLELTTNGGSFFTGIEQAKTHAKSLGATITAINRDTARMATSLSGRPIIAEATKLTNVIKALGGVERLTNAERARANPILAEALEKWRALGRPMTDATRLTEQYAAATKQTEPVTRSLSSAVLGMGKNILSTAAGFFTAQAAFSAVRSVVRLLIDEFKELTVGGAAVGDVTDNFERLTAGAGHVGATLLGVLRTGTHRTIDDFRLMKTVNQDLAAGLRLTDTQFGVLAKGAFALAQSTGGDVADGLETMNEAMLTGRTRSLALLTGKLNETKAEENFARSLGVTADELSEDGKLHARRLAMLNAVAAATERLGHQTDGLDERVAQAQTFWKNFHNKLGRTIADSPVIAAALTSLHETLQRAFGASQQDLVKGLTRQIEDFAIGFVRFAQVGVSSAGIVAKGFIALYKVLGDGRQIIDGITLATLYLGKAEMALPNAVGIGTKAWAANDAAIQDLLVTMSARGKALTQADAAQAGVDATTTKFTATLEAMRAAMVKARETANGQAAALDKVGKAAKGAGAGFGDGDESFIQANKDAEKFSVALKALARDVERGLTSLSDSEFAKEFGAKLLDNQREMEKFGITGAKVPEAIRKGFIRLNQIDFAAWIAKDTAEILALNDGIEGTLAAIDLVEDARQASNKVQADAAMRTDAVARQSGIRRTEAVIESAKRTGATWQQMAALESVVSKQRLDAALAASRAEFTERTRSITHRKAEYEAYAREQQAIEAGMVQDWQLGEAEKLAATLRVHNVWLRSWDKMRSTSEDVIESVSDGIANLEKSTIGNLGTLLFGFGHDQSGDLRRAADEAKQEYLKLSRTAKATTEEMGLAFRTWREAENRANFTFGERFKEVWRSIKSTVQQILNDLLKYFTEQFLVGLIKGMAGAKLGQKLGGFLGGAGGGGGGVGGAALQTAAGFLPSLVSNVGGGAALLPNLSTPALTAGLSGAGGSAAAGTAAGTAGGGAGAAGFLSNPAFWTNPWTIGIAGGIAFGTLAWKKGWFGLNQGGRGNNNRDKFLAQFSGFDTKRDPNNPPGFYGLGALLAKYKKEALFSNLIAAKGPKEIKRAEQPIAAFLSTLGRNVKTYAMGGFTPPGAVELAMVHGGSRGELHLPVAQMGAMRSGEVHVYQHNTLQVNQSSIDPKTSGEHFDREILPRLKHELVFNNNRLASVVKRAIKD